MGPPEAGDVEAVAAAQRIKGLLEEAKEHGHYTNGWYAYLARWDVEACVDAVLRFADVHEGRDQGVRQEARAEVLRPQGSQEVAREPDPEAADIDLQLRLSG